MSYRVQLPNGQQIDIDDNVPPEKARQMIVRQFPDLFKRKQGFKAAMGAGWDSEAGSIQSGLADLSEQAGLPTIGKWLRSASDKNKQEAAKGFDPTTDEDVDAAFKRGAMSGIGALAQKYVTEPAGGMVGSLGPSAAGAAAGTLVGAPMLGFAAPFAVGSYGRNVDTQKEATPGQDPNRLNATAAALLQTTLGTFGFGRMINGVVGQGLAMREASKLAPKVLTGEITKEAAVHQLGGNLRNILAETVGSATINIGTGVADEALRRGQAGMPLADKDAQDAYKHIAAAGAVLSPVFGVAHGAGARGKATGVLSDTAAKGEQQRLQIRREQQEDAIAGLQAEQNVPEPTVITQPPAKTPEQAKSLIKEQNFDAARRAVEQRDQPGVLNPDRPLEVIPTDGMARREDARAAFANAEEDLLGLKEPTPEMPAEAPARRATDPVLTKREDFADMVYPHSRTFKDGRLDGHDLATPDGVNGLLKVLKPYLNNVESLGGEKNIPRIEMLHKKINELELIRDQMKAQEELPFDKGAERVQPVVTDTPVRAATPMEEVHAPTKTADAPAPDVGSNLGDLGQRDQQQALPAQLPAPDGRTDGRGDVPAPAGVRQEVPVDRTLTAQPEPVLALENKPHTPPISPAEERAAFGRASGAVVDAGGHVLKGHEQNSLGRAMDEGDFEGVVSALANSKNVFIKHVGEQAAKLTGVSVRKMAGDELDAAAGMPKAKGMFDPKENEVIVRENQTKKEHAVAHEMVHALTHDAIDNPTPNQKYFVDKLNTLHNHVRSVMPNKKDYGLKDVHEFVSEAMTNPDFQQKLSKIKYQNTTAWGKFTEWVAKLLGLKNDNAFTEFLANFEGLSKADGGLKAAKSDAPPKMLGDYALSATPDVHRGVVGTAVDAVKDVRQAGTKSALGEAKDKLIQGLFDDKHGITRHLMRAWTKVNEAGQRVATARALLQASTYASQLARESLSLGFVKKNAEGFWKIERTDSNLRAFLDAVNALPTDTDKFRVANGIMTNLAYHEREQMLANNKAGAKKLLDDANRELREAKKLKGTAAAKAINKAKARKAMAEDLLETEYKRPASVTDDSIAQALTDAKTPEVKRMLDIVRDINRQNIDMLEEGGVISKETAELWKEKQHYVPLHRIMDDDPAVSHMLLAQGGARTKDIKAFKGSEREVEDITENLIRQRMYVVDAAMRNNAFAKAIGELSAEPGNPAGVTRIGPRAGKGNHVMVKEGGEKVYYRVDDEMAFQTFQGLIQDAPGLVEALEPITRFFRNAIMLSPDAIFRNLVRDTADVWAFGASNKSIAGVVARIFGQFTKSMPGVVREGFGNKLHQPHYEVSAFGITGAKEFTSLDAERRAIIGEQLKKHGTRDWAATADGIIDGMARLIKPLENAAAEGELAPRNHVFKEVLERTGSETEAAMAAINTLDFRRRGAWHSITVAKKLIPFFNSQLQGWYKLASGLAGDNLSSGITDRKQAMRALYLKGLKMAAAAWAYQTAMQDDEDYMEVKKEIRDMNILIPAGTDDNGKTVFMKLALPHEYGSIFWTLPANLTSYVAGKQEGKEFTDSMQAAAWRAIPSLIPQAAKPMLENTTNHSFFTGKSLENESMQRIEPGKRATDSTTELSKEVGDATGMSPIKLDNFLRGYLGTLGMVGVQVIDKLLLEDGSDPEKAWHRAPVLRSLTTDPLSSASRDKFYQLKETVEQVYNTANSLKGKPDEARAYLAKETSGTPNKVLYDMHRGISQLTKELQRAGQAEKEIKASSDTPEMKRARLEHIRRVMNAKLQKAMPTLRDYMEEDVDATVEEGEEEE
jgi:hypothetical protein